MSHYIDNAKFLEEHRKWKLQYLENKEKGLPAPEINRYLCECIMMIAKRLSTRFNWRQYTYRDEMVGDGIENCIRYFYSFKSEDPAFNNIFSYFTRVIECSFIRRLQKEKQQTTIKSNMIRELDIESFADATPEELDMIRSYFEDIKSHDVLADKPIEPKKKRQKAEKTNTLFANVEV